jgi:dephospho-CoA kinase
LPRPCVIGLTGASGSGKTEVAGILRRLGAEVIDADEVSREAARDAGALRELRDALGAWVLDADGNFDRRAVAQRAFGDKEILDRLTAITHRYIINRIDAMVSDWKKRGIDRIGGAGEAARRPVLVIDAPLPVKRGFLDNADVVWVVASDRELKLRRIAARDGISREQAEARLAAQMDDSGYIRLADAVFENNGAPAELEEQAVRAWNGLALRMRADGGPKGGS